MRSTWKRTWNINIEFVTFQWGEMTPKLDDGYAAYG